MQHQLYEDGGWESQDSRLFVFSIVGDLANLRVIAVGRNGRLDQDETMTREEARVAYKEILGYCGVKPLATEDQFEGASYQWWDGDSMY